MKTKLIFSFLERIVLVALAVAVAVCMLTVQYIQAAETNLRQQISEGGLELSIVDAAYADVTDPGITFSSHTFSFDCGTTTGILGSATQRLYVQNPDSADNGWSITIAPKGGATSTWVSATEATAEFDFNDPNGGGCTDGSDTDSVAGSLTIDPSAATLATGTCAACTDSDINLGTESTFSDTVGSITLITATASSSDIGDWTIEGINLTQIIPGEQEAYDDYQMDMTMTIAAS